MRWLCLFKAPCPQEEGWAPPILPPGLLPSPAGGLRAPQIPSGGAGALFLAPCRAPSPPPRSCWVVRRWSMLVLILFPGVTWKGTEARQGGGSGEGLGTGAGGRDKDAARECRAAAAAPAQRLPPRGTLPSSGSTPCTARCRRGARRGGRRTGTSSPHPTSPFSCTLAAPQRCTWAGGGGVCSAALRLSSAWGRERELFVPVIACRAPGLANPRCAGAASTHRSGHKPQRCRMPPAQSSGGCHCREERTSSPVARRRCPPARAAPMARAP